MDEKERQRKIRLVLHMEDQRLDLVASGAWGRGKRGDSNVPASRAKKDPALMEPGGYF